MIVTEIPTLYTYNCNRETRKLLWKLNIWRKFNETNATIAKECIGSIYFNY